jgi:uncharacterized protein (DUF849 family)
MKKGNSVSPIIINLAPTGMIPTKEMTTHVPISVAEIVEDVNKCIKLGANIIHLHARGEDGLPTWRKETYQKLIAGIREINPKVLLGVSLSGRNWSDYEKRGDALQIPGEYKPDLASLTLSSMNFATGASINSPDTIMRLAEEMLTRGIKPELEIFDLGMVNYALYLLNKGLLVRPLYFNFIFGNVAGVQPKPTHLTALLNDLPEDSVWTAGGIGRHQFAANQLGLANGNGVRVGLEDNYFADLERTELATNQSLVAAISERASELKRSVATASEARAMLGL